jgi:anti-anti-sigma factor
MTMAPMGTSRVYRPDPSRLGRNERWGPAEARSTATTKSVVITVRGEIDASNGPALANYVECHAGIAAGLVLDLSGVEFFGTAGLAALRRIDRCRDCIGWMLVPSAAVRRVLRVCHAEDLPHVDTVADAVRALEQSVMLSARIP